MSYAQGLSPGRDYAARPTLKGRAFVMLGRLRALPLSTWLSAIALVVALAAFAAVALHQLHLPGFYYDEALDLAPMLDLMRGETPELLRGVGVAGRFPVMLLDYMGSLGGYLTVPFMWVFGVGYQAARAQPLFFSTLSIVLAWLLARRWFGDAVAALATIALAVNPSLIWFSRQGISVTSVMLVCSLGSVLLLQAALDHPHRARGLVFAAGLLLGLGLWAKFLFFRWWVVMVIGAAMLALGLWRERLTHAVMRRVMGWLGAGVAIGAAPLIYYNLVGLLREGDPWTLSLLWRSLAQPTQQFGVNNWDVLSNLRKSIDDVRVFVDGSYFWYNGIPFSNVYAVPSLLSAAVVGGALAVLRARCADAETRAQGWRFFAALSALPTLTFLGAFTVTGLWSTHHFIMLPIPQLLLACAAVWLAEAALNRLRRGRTIAVWALSLTLVSWPLHRDVWVNQMHHETLARTGGVGRFSDAVYRLADWLDHNAIYAPIALDWGIQKSVRVLTADRVRPIEVFGHTPQADARFYQQVAELLQHPEHYYIVLWERFAVYNRRAEFTEIARQMGRQVEEVFIAHERSGLPVYVVLRAN